MCEGYDQYANRWGHTALAGHRPTAIRANAGATGWRRQKFYASSGLIIGAAVSSMRSSSSSCFSFAASTPASTAAVTRPRSRQRARRACSMRPIRALPKRGDRLARALARASSKLTHLLARLACIFRRSLPTLRRTSAGHRCRVALRRRQSTHQLLAQGRNPAVVAIALAILHSLRSCECLPHFQSLAYPGTHTRQVDHRTGNCLLRWRRW